MNGTPQTFFDALELRIGLIADKQKLSLSERENLWSLAVNAYRAALLAGQKKGPVKKDLAAWLWRRLPALGESESAIFFQLYRKIKSMAETGGVADKRREAGWKKRAPMLSIEDRAALVNEAYYTCGGKVDFAWQNCLHGKLLSKELLSRHSTRGDRRPRCPKNIRRQVAPEIKALYQHHVRPHSNSNNVAPMTRDWSNVFAQDIYECDDKTLDVICRITVEEKGGQVEKEIRCQFLPMIDVKSGKILDFVLIAEAAYNTISIRTLITRVCEKYGLPGSFSFERGIWKSGKLLGNNAKGKPPAEVENFARRIGAPINHALAGRARTKIVETVFRLLDRKMYGWPGYIGRDEMREKFERARAGGLWTYDELFAQLVRAVEEYNDTKSDSIVKGGYLTPNEVWENCRRKTEAGEIIPAVKLPPEFRFLLAEHCAEVTVREYGVKTSIGRQQFQFHSAELTDFISGLRDQKVKVWFDPGNPDTAVVTDLKEERFFPVVRVPNAPAHATTEAEWQMFADASAPYRTNARQVRQRYSDLKKTYIPPFRATIADAPARVKAQERSEAKKASEQQFAERQITPVESKEDRAARKAANLAASDFFGRNNQPLIA